MQSNTLERTLHLGQKRVGASETGHYFFRVESIAARDSVQIGRVHSLDGGLHLGIGVLRWSKLVEIWNTQKETTEQPPTERVHFTCAQRQLLTSKATREIEARS